jgi:hypothetical protein
MEVDMALVRRSAVVGRAHVPAAVIPPQPGTPYAVDPGATPAPPPGAPGGSPSAPAIAGVVPGHENAAAVPTLPAKGWAVVTGLGLAVVGAFAAFNIQEFAAPTIFRIGDQPTAFGALFVFAAAVERVLEPFSRFMPGRKPQARYEKAVADMDNGVPGAMNAVALYKAAVDSARSSRGVIMWGLATAAATVLSASGGFCLLHMLSADPGWNGVSYWADCLITGLVVGSGTKPLHDLITKVQSQTSSTQIPA